MVNIIIPEEKVVGEDALKFYHNLMEYECVFDYKFLEKVNPYKKDMIK